MSQLIEDVRDNIVKIVDEKESLNGTGFILEIDQKRYCITCHHCICRINEINIERGNTKCSVEYIEELSESNKDIAVMEVNNCNNIKSLKYAKETLPQLSVSMWGYSENEIRTFPQGAPVKKGTLSDAPFLFSWPEENVKGIRKWNKKPEVKVYVFQYDGKFQVGYSGAPVCYTGNNSVIGVFTARDDSYGYVIPIETILGKFKPEKRIAQSSPPVNITNYIEKGNQSIMDGEYEEAISQYQFIINDRNYRNALLNTGVALHLTGKNKEAIEYYKRVLQIDANDPFVLSNKGLSHLNLEEYEEAITCYDKVLDIDPNRVPALNNKGFILFKLRRWNEALEYFRKVLEIDPNNSYALNKISLINDKSKRHA